jgi:hypothetical protein
VSAARPFGRAPRQLLPYLGERNIATFSTDIDSRDFRMHNPDQVIKSAMSQLEKHACMNSCVHTFAPHTYHPVQCSACGGSHLVDPTTGEAWRDAIEGLLDE